eukprot:3819938-Prorocentrum_lima.AAC.1
MIVEVCVLEAGLPGQDWCLKLHIPMKLTPTFVDEQFKWFKEKWEDRRPDVPVEFSSTYYGKGDLMDGVHAEIHQF